ncbi:MAG: GGDEF domain-containing protein [Thermodesulfobacteriota bacterium]
MKVLVLGKEGRETKELVHDLASWGFDGVPAADAAEAGRVLAGDAPPRIMMVCPESAADVSALSAVQDELPIHVAIFLCRENEPGDACLFPPGALFFPLSSPRAALSALLALARNLVRTREELAETRKDLERLSIMDLETGLDSRIHFLARGRTEISRSVRYRRTMSVLVADMDHFRRINAEHGREKARKAFAEFADACRKNLRENDLIGRLGEDSLAVILPEADAKSAFLAGEKLRHLTESLSAGLDGMNLTASIGIATLMLGEASFEKLIQRAEKALAQAKVLGGNRVATG